MASGEPDVKPVQHLGLGLGKQGGHERVAAGFDGAVADADEQRPREEHQEVMG